MRPTLNTTPPVLLAAALLTLGACASAIPDTAAAPEPEPALKNVGIAAADAPLQPGDCVEARRRLDADPEMTVDKVPAPVAMKPAPFQRVPTRAWNKDGSATIKAEVVIDTLGRADMATFKPIEVSNAWFTSNLKSVLPRWKFAPAELAGCKVRRVYRFSASMPAWRKR